MVVHVKVFTILYHNNLINDSSCFDSTYSGVSTLVDLFKGIRSSGLSSSLRSSSPPG